MDEADPSDFPKRFPAELLPSCPISTRLNKPENDDPSILDPVFETARRPRLLASLAIWSRRSGDAYD